MASDKEITFLCTECGDSFAKWSGKCPSCGTWGALKEFREPAVDKKGRVKKSEKGAKPVPLSSCRDTSEERIVSGIEEFDNVLGGGVVKGSAVLVGGSPGIGKSTLMLQCAANLSEKEKSVLYVSGEESPSQVQARAERLGYGSASIDILDSPVIKDILKALSEKEYDLCIVDSIQTLYLSTLDSSPGSVSQIRECTSILITKIKTLDTAVMLVAHINKDGNIAGPKIIEHVVDAVLYFEGEKNNDLRILRGIKNRYGPAGELAIFSMGESGLDQVKNASAFFIQMMGEDQKGAAAVPVIEGRRVLLVELQSLVNQTHFGLPVRVSNGIPQKRLSLIIAVIEKFTGIKLSDYDIYFNIAGGLSIAEPALELGVAASIISSFKNIPLKKDTAFIGELGLGGEIRPVSGMYKRVNEISKLGFKMCFGPKMRTKKHSSLNTEYRVCNRISELENILF